MKLNRSQLSWIGYDMANAAFALVVRTVYAQLFFKNFVYSGTDSAFSTSLLGYVSSGAGIAAGILAPWLGSIADANSSRLKFLGGFLILGVGATLGLCFAGNGDETLMLSCYFLSLLSYMAGNSFYDALLPSISSKGGSDRLSALSYAWGYVGGVIPFVICLVISLCLKDSPVAGARIAFIITALWWGILSIPMFRNVREKRIEGAEKIQALDGFRKLWETAKEVKKHRNAALYLVAYFLYIDGVGTILIMATAISQDIGIPQNWLLITILLLQFLGFPFTILYGVLSNRFGARKMLYCAITVYTLIALLVGAIPFFGNQTVKLVLFSVAAFLISTSQGGIQSLSRSFFNRLIPKGQAAQFFGFYNIFGKFTTILGPLLVGLAVWLFNDSCFGIAMLAVPFALGGFLLTKVRTPKNG